MVKGMQFMIDDSYRMDEVDDDDGDQPSPSPPSPPPPPQSNNTGKTVKGMQFLIKDSYTMDEVGDDDDDDPSPSLSSPPPPQSNEEVEQHEKSDLKRPPEELLSSPQTLYVVEEKKSDSVGSSNALSDVIILNESDESDDHENKEIATSLFADLSITPQSSNLHEEAIQSSTQNNTIESSPAAASTVTIDNNISGGKKTMAMVKFRVWDPAAPSKQFKFITATTVLLLPQSSNNNDGADDEKGNNESSSNDLKKIERLYSNSRQQKMQLQQRLSSVKEERRGSRDSTIYDDTTDEDETDTNTSNHANSGCGEDDEQQQQQEGGRRRTIKIDNKSIKHNLSQLSNDDDDDDDENENDKMNQLQVGNVVGIYLKKSALSSTKSNNNNSSSTQQINNTTTAKNINEWKVGNSIRVLHNLNLIPLHTTGLEQLLHQIESNHPSLRELILDGITTIPQYSSLSTTTTSQQHQHQLQTPLSTSHMEVLIEAIGKNTSIKKCSLRYSQITDDIASMLALALVDNTTMTSLSLRGNQLTSSSIKNFYSVLKSDENISLRLLDITDNSLIEEDVQCAFEQFMQQRNMKRKLILRAEKAKRIARGMPLLNEMLEEEEEEEEEDGGWRIGSGDVGGRRHVTNNGSDGGGSCCVTVVCHPGIMDGTFYNETQQLLRRSDGSSGNSFGSYPQSVGVMAGSRAGEEEEEYQRFAESVSSDITGIGNEGAGARGGSPSQQQQQQQQQLQPFVQPIGSELYPQSQPYYQQQQQQQKQHQEPMPYHPQQRRSNNRRLDPNYNMMFSSQGSSTDDEGGNDSSTTSNTGNESLDQRQRQQLATVNGGVGGRGGGGHHHNNSPNRNNRRSYNTRPSTTTASTTSNNSLNLSAQDYMDDKADEREIRRQLATQGQAIGAYAIDDEAPNRQEVRGRRTRVSRTESQRRARLAELGNNGGGSGGGGVAATTTIAEGDLVDADIERMEEYEYRNLSMSQKAFSKIGLGGEDKWTERVVCLTFGVCFVVLVIAISLYVARGS